MIKQIYIRSIVWIPVLILFLYSCEKPVTNITLPTSAPKLVAGCFISPQDTVISLTLSRSNPIFGAGHSNNNSSMAVVPDALVYISNGIRSSLIPFNSVKQKYELASSAFPITPGQTYSLTVSTPKGESVSSSCSIPASNLSSLTVDYMDTTSFHNDVVVKWKDIPNETNYYRVFGEIVSVAWIPVGDTIFDRMNVSTMLFNDHEKDGSQLNSRLNGYSSISFSPPGGKRLGYDIYVLNIDAEYYNYQNSLNHYTNQDPFSEPNPLYTNIKGGLGVFAGYQKFCKRFP